ncbi:MAG: hypothetical protein M3P06_04335 [Acidobacteriota bacterium]|nr:hypothetical protein [Acidobacteriota bacterium]
MRSASTVEIKTSNLTPAFIATVSASELLELFPVNFEGLDPLQAPEPSSLALLHFASGPAAIVFGSETGTITVSLPDDDDAPRIFDELIAEVPLGDRIQWIREDLAERNIRSIQRRVSRTRR